MSLTFTPYGLRPINRVGGTAYVGSTRAIKIASAYAQNLFHGQGVTIHTDGTLIREALNSSPRVIGVFMGCSFTQATGVRYFLEQQYWAASTVAADALGYVVDDPFALFQIQADGTVAQASLSENVNVSGTSGATGTDGSTTTGNSTMAAAATTATTDTWPWRLVDFVINPGQNSIVGDAFTELIVSWRFGAHNYFVALGF